MTPLSTIMEQPVATGVGGVALDEARGDKDRVAGPGHPSGARRLRRLRWRAAGVERRGRSASRPHRPLLERGGCRKVFVESAQ